jgi:hypothetical protein
VIPAASHLQKVEDRATPPEPREVRKPVDTSRGLPGPLLHLAPTMEVTGSTHDVVRICLQLLMDNNSLVEDYALGKKAAQSNSAGPGVPAAAVPISDVAFGKFVDMAVHALLQLLVHVTRADVHRQAFIRQGGINQLLTLRSNQSDGDNASGEPGQSTASAVKNMVSTIIQHSIEDPVHLQAMMETTIRLAMSRLVSKRSSASGTGEKDKLIPFRSIVDIVSPLIYRSQEVFMKAFVNVCSFELRNSTATSSSKYATLNATDNILVSVKPPNAPPASHAAQYTPVRSAISTAAIADAGENDLLLSTKRRRSVSSDSNPTSNTATESQDTKRTRTGSGSGSVSGSLVRDSDPAYPPIDPAMSSRSLTASKQVKSANKGASTMKQGQLYGFDSVTSANAIAIVDEMIRSMVVKWALIQKVIALSGTSTDATKEAASALVEKHTQCLSISNLLTSLADLAVTVPSVGQYICRKVLPPSIQCGSEIGQQPFHVEHCVCVPQHGKPSKCQWVANATFLSLVIHEFTTKSYTPPAVSKSNLNQEEAAVSEHKQTLVERLAGENMREATAYFVAAMVSRVGETRKKIISELSEPLSAFVASSGTQDHAHSSETIIAVASIVETIRSLLHPLPLWSQRKTFVLPFKDVLASLVASEIDKLLVAVMCSVNVCSMSGYRLAAAVTAPLDIILRKLSLVGSPIQNASSGNSRRSSIDSEHHSEQELPLPVALSQSSATEHATVISVVPGLERSGLDGDQAHRGDQGPLSTANSAAFNTPNVAEETQEQMDRENAHLLLSGDSSGLQHEYSEYEDDDEDDAEEEIVNAMRDGNYVSQEIEVTSDLVLIASSLINCVVFP